MVCGSLQIDVVAQPVAYYNINRWPRVQDRGLEVSALYISKLIPIPYCFPSSVTQILHYLNDGSNMEKESPRGCSSHS